MNPAEIDDLRDHYDRCMKLAKSWGLEPYEVDFHVVPAEKMYEIASYGVPGHFSHWTYGRDFWRTKTTYDYGYHKIYELVINSNPAQAFLLDINSLIENMFVIAHVIGHSDFFATNAYYAHTNRRIEESVTATANRFREYELKYGRRVVEEFIDNVFTISEHVDPQLRTKKVTTDYVTARNPSPYVDLFPEEALRGTIEEMAEELNKYMKFPYQPERDLLGFIAEHGKLHEWQRDVILSIREETIYFLPQMQTQIMNEGWASYIHRKMMHELDPEVDPGGVEFAEIHSSVLSGRPGALNPYWLGFNIYSRIFERWENPDEKDREELGLTGGEGWEKLLEVRATDSDISFLRNHVDEKICTDLDLFSYGFNPRGSQWEVTETQWEQVRDSLVDSKVNMGIPYIVIEDANHRNTGALYLKHIHDGRDLHRRYLLETLKCIYKLWGRPVYLETILEDNTKLFWVDEDDVHEGI